MEDHPDEDNLEAYVWSKAFEEECIALAASWKTRKRRSSSDSDSINSLWSSDDGSSVPSVEVSPHNVPKLEAYLYYAGLSGPNRRGPKLIYRTSSDKFIPPNGP